MGRETSYSFGKQVNFMPYCFDIIFNNSEPKCYLVFITRGFKFKPLGITLYEQTCFRQLDVLFNFPVPSGKDLMRMHCINGRPASPATPISFPGPVRLCERDAAALAFFGGVDACASKV